MEGSCAHQVVISDEDVPEGAKLAETTAVSTSHSPQSAMCANFGRTLSLTLKLVACAPYGMNVANAEPSGALTLNCCSGCPRAHIHQRVSQRLRRARRLEALTSMLL